MPGIIKCYNNACPAYNTKEVDNCSKPLTRILECPDAVICYNQDIKPAKYYRRILVDPSCICGRQKNKGMALCYTCYNGLSYRVKRDLYQKLGFGFEQAYEEAIKELR